MSIVTPKIDTQREEEWRELQAVLQSGILDNAPNLSSFLNYVAERHFSGTTNQIKEYSVAVHALHRSEGFDPQSNNIVRVTAHTLRKKLEQYYLEEGADHPIHIRLPAGKYVLQFERMGQAAATPLDSTGARVPVQLAAGRKRPRSPQKWVKSLGLSVVVGAVLLLLGIVLFRYSSLGAPVKLDSVVSQPGDEAGSGALTTSGKTQQSSIRVRFGASPKSFVDVAGPEVESRPVLQRRLQLFPLGSRDSGNRRSNTLSERAPREV